MQISVSKFVQFDDSSSFSELDITEIMWFTTSLCCPSKFSNANGSLFPLFLLSARNGDVGVDFLVLEHKRVENVSSHQLVLLMVALQPTSQLEEAKQPTRLLL